jgi:hypothetical protein
MNRRFKVLLATRSRLYAPIYHAWSTSGESIKNHIQLEFADSSSKRDELVDRTLRSSNDLRSFNDDNILFSVGDLTRLHNYSNDAASSLSDPIIISGFIDKICLWLIDGDDEFMNKEHNSTRDNRIILCHPKNMTTYCVAAYHMKNTEGWSKDILSKQLMPIVRPGWESDYYNNMKRVMRKKQRLAYMSSEIKTTQKRQ